MTTGAMTGTRASVCCWSACLAGVVSRPPVVAGPRPLLAAVAGVGAGVAVLRRMRGICRACGHRGSWGDPLTLVRRPRVHVRHLPAIRGRAVGPPAWPSVTPPSGVSRDAPGRAWLRRQWALIRDPRVAAEAEAAELRAALVLAAVRYTAVTCAEHPGERGVTVIVRGGVPVVARRVRLDLAGSTVRVRRGRHLRVVREVAVTLTGLLVFAAGVLGVGGRRGVRRAVRAPSRPGPGRCGGGPCGRQWRPGRPVPGAAAHSPGHHPAGRPGGRAGAGAGRARSWDAPGRVAGPGRLPRGADRAPGRHPDLPRRTRTAPGTSPGTPTPGSSPARPSPTGAGPATR